MVSPEDSFRHRSKKQLGSDQFSDLEYCRLTVTEPSLERQRGTFEKRELELMAEVRDLRKRLAARRQQRPPGFLGNTQL